MKNVLEVLHKMFESAAFEHISNRSARVKNVYIDTHIASKSYGLWVAAKRIKPTI